MFTKKEAEKLDFLESHSNRKITIVKKGNVITKITRVKLPKNSITE